MFERVLVPIDGSGPSRAATGLAIQLAKRHRSNLIFLFVVDVPAAAINSPSTYLYQLESERTRGEMLLRSANKIALQNGLRSETLNIEGPCVATILETAKLRQTDLIVIGSHGRNGLGRMMLGSVAEGVSRASSVPVMTVHGPARTQPRANGATSVRPRTMRQRPRAKPVVVF